MTLQFNGRGWFFTFSIERGYFDLRTQKVVPDRQGYAGTHLVRCGPYRSAKAAADAMRPPILGPAWL